MFKSNSGAPAAVDRKYNCSNINKRNQSEYRGHSSENIPMLSFARPEVKPLSNKKTKLINCTLPRINLLKVLAFRPCSLQYYYSCDLSID